MGYRRGHQTAWRSPGPRGPSPRTACPEGEAEAWVAMRGPLWGQEGTQVHPCDPVPQPQGMGEGRGRETGEGAGTATGEGERGSCSQDTRDSEGGDRTVSGPNTVRAAASHRGRTWQGRGGGRAGREDPVPLSGAAAPHHARPPPGIGLGGPAAGPVGLLTLTAALLRPPTPEPQGGPSPLHLGAPQPQGSGRWPEHRRVCSRIQDALTRGLAMGWKLVRPGGA